MNISGRAATKGVFRYYATLLLRGESYRYIWLSETVDEPAWSFVTFDSQTLTQPSTYFDNINEVFTELLHMVEGWTTGVGNAVCWIAETWIGRLLNHELISDEQVVATLREMLAAAMPEASFEYIN